MQRVLIIQTAFIGDVVLATALLESVHDLFPEAKIDFLVRKGNESLFLEHPYLHQVLIWEKEKRKYRSLFQLLFKIRKSKYDIVLNLQRYAATGFLTAFSGAKETIGFNKNPFHFLFSKSIKHEMTNQENPLHEIERNHLLLAAFTPGATAKPKLYPPQTAVASIQPYTLAPFICIAPASVWFTKQYPMHKWIELIQHLPADYVVYLLGGSGDKAICDDIISTIKRENVISLAGQLSFLSSAALMKAAAMNYVNDSAPMHFCSAVNAPVTAVYCSTIPGFGYGPLSDKQFVVESKETLACRPCGLHGKPACPLGHYNCAETISVSQLLQSLPA